MCSEQYIASLYAEPVGGASDKCSQKKSKKIRDNSGCAEKKRTGKEGGFVSGASKGAEN